MEIKALDSEPQVLFSDTFDDAVVDSPLEGRTVNNALGGTLTPTWKDGDAAGDAARIGVAPLGNSKAAYMPLNYCVLSETGIAAGQDYELGFTLDPSSLAAWSAFGFELDDTALNFWGPSGVYMGISTGWWQVYTWPPNKYIRSSSRHTQRGGNQS